MAVLRSARNKKITFNDDGDIPEGSEIVMVDTRESTHEPETHESDSNSDDAPEEESTSKARDDVLAKAKAEQDLQKEALKAAKEKRKQRDLQFKKQQEAKREKERKERERQEKLEQERLETASLQEDVLPDLLPEELLGVVEPEVKGTSKHLRSEDLEAEHAAMRKKMKLEKLRELKQKSIKKGPIHVQVQEFGSSKIRVPRAEQSVVDVKGQWLQRESLNRK